MSRNQSRCWITTPTKPARKVVSDFRSENWFAVSLKSFQLSIHFLPNIGAIAVLCGSLLVGCSGSGKEAAAPQIVSPQKEVAPSGPPQSADAAVRQVLDGLRQHNVRTVWEFLPPSHRMEIQNLVRDVAMQLDETSWKATVAVWRKASKVIPPRSNSIFGIGKSGSEVANNRTSAVDSESLQRLFDSIGNSELAEIKRMRQIDVGLFLEKTGGDVLQTLGSLATSGEMSSQAFEKLSKVEVTLVTASMDSATVSIKWPNQEPTTHEYVRVEGCWFPRVLAEVWTVSLSDIRRQAMAWAEGLKQQPEAWHARLNAVDQVLDEIAATKTDEDARVAYQKGMQRLVGAWFEQPPSVPEKISVSPTVKKRKLPDTEEVLPDEK